MNNLAYNTVESFSDDELIEKTNTAYSNLKTASEVAPNSITHSESFAALLILADEMNNRKLKTSTVH